MLLTIVLLCFLIIVGSYHLYRTHKKLMKFSDLIPVSELKDALLTELSLLNEEKVRLINETEKLTISKNDELGLLDAEIGNKKIVVSSLEKSISELERHDEFLEAGFYMPRYRFLSSEEYKERLITIRNKLKDLIRDKKAITCDIPWTVNGSKREGEKMTNQTIRLSLSSYNGQVDNIILSVNHKNIESSEEKIDKVKTSVEKMLQVNKCYVSNEYHSLKKDELFLAFEYEEKLFQEKEEQRKIRLQMQEEERERRIIEKQRAEAEQQEKECIKELLKAKKELEKAHDLEKEKLLQEILTLEAKLSAATESKMRAVSMAEQTKRGHVYIISNIGSFGENIFKIGLTRRLFPQERVDELGDASVPFEFDVHGMIFSEDAPSLERQLHTKFNHKRLNRVNLRKEFFSLNIQEIQKACSELGHSVQLLEIPEAREYHQSKTFPVDKEAA